MTTAVRALYRIPLLGSTLREAIGGSQGALFLLIAYVLAVAVGVVLRFGYPALIVMALGATAVCLVMLMVLTAGDIFSKPGKGH